MANQNYSEFKSRSQNRNSGGPGVKTRKGSYGAEHDSAQKDTEIKWPKAPGPRSRSLNTVKFPIVKVTVKSDGIDQ